MGGFITVVSMFTFATIEMMNRMNETCQAVLANARKINPGVRPDLYVSVVAHEDGCLDFHFSTEGLSLPEGSVRVQFGAWDVKRKDLVPPELIEQLGIEFYDDLVALKKAVGLSKKAA
jgi:hypothetical protein